MRTIDSSTMSSDSSRSDCCQVFLFPSCILKLTTLFASSHFDGPQSMKRKSSSRKSKTNFRRLRTMTGKDVRLTPEHPEIDLKHVAHGIVRRGLRIVPTKASVSLRIDADVLEWFKLSGAGYQTRMNAVLRAFMEVSA